MEDQIFHPKTNTDAWNAWIGWIRSKYFSNQKLIEVEYEPVEYEMDYFDNEFYCSHADQYDGEIGTSYDPADSITVAICSECDKWYNESENTWHK